MDIPKKSLGQHWLHDEATLNYIAGAADISPDDTILEIGPGTGTLTAKLLNHGAKVIAVEKDEVLVTELKERLSDYIPTVSKAGPWKQGLVIVEGDILNFDLGQLPSGYKVVANIPYYLTSNLLRVLSESSNSPTRLVLLVQKEVAQRICAEPGQMSLLTVSVQLYYEPTLGQIVPAKLFTPPPKVDSRVIILNRREEPLFADLDSQKFFQLVKAGFSERRKMLRSSLAGGLNISKDQAEDLLKKAGINPSSRAQELSLQQWYSLYKSYAA